MVTGTLQLPRLIQGCFVFFNYNLLMYPKLTINLALVVFIFFPIADLKNFSSCNVIQQINKCITSSGASLPKASGKSRSVEHFSEQL